MLHKNILLIIVFNFPILFKLLKKENNIKNIKIKKQINCNRYYLKYLFSGTFSSSVKYFVSPNGRIL